MRWSLCAISLLLITACAAEQFTVSSLSLSMEREAVIPGDAEEETELLISSSFSDPERSYTFRIVSPDGDLSWEGAFTGTGEEKTSVPLEITEGALFPQGEYSIIIYSDNGTELEDKVSLHYEETLRCFENDLLSGAAYVTEYNADGIVVAEGRREEGYEKLEESVRAVIEYRDGRGNRVNVTQSFQPSSSDPSPSA